MTPAGVVLEAAPVPDAELALKKFRPAPGLKLDLFAQEPDLVNPVAFTIDEHGRIYVAETFRYRTSAFDIRHHMTWYADDLASRTVADRLAMIQKFLGADAAKLGVESEVVRVLEDREGKGKVTHSRVFADGFSTLLDGIGSGVLARKGDIYYTDIPNLWRLRDTTGAGRANVRESLSYGYGVHFGLTGHDLHGLRFGPDGKLYFSVGDRGYNVTTREGRRLEHPHEGAVFRCNADGSELEVFAYGLRNPQELAFDDHGNLFTGDNNCDHGDAARWVYVVEAGDSGWRIGYQFSETTTAGAWNAEKLWHLRFPGQAAYLIPPIAHISDGPSGLTHFPGTGFAAKYRDHFLLCDFRGAEVNSGIHAFANEPRGAGFELVDRSHFLWNVLATDVEFGPDGRVYVSDWVRGWPKSELGRLYRAFDPELVGSPLVRETQKLIGAGMDHRPLGQLAALLAHADQRVRQEAQFALAERNASAITTLANVAASHANPLARLHAIWGLGQIGRANFTALERVLPLLDDQDAEVRAQAAKVIGDGRLPSAFGPLVKLLTDTQPRPRYFAALALGKLGRAEATAPLLELLRANADQDVFLRHAGVMGLAWTHSLSALLSATGDPSPAVRMGVLLALRRLERPELAMFLHDTDPLLVVEAARAINDLPVAAAMPELASLISAPTASEPLMRRVLNANFRLGTTAGANALAAYAARDASPGVLRIEALRYLGSWATPAPRDRVIGLWRPLPPRDASVAASAMEPLTGALFKAPQDSVRMAAAAAIEKLGFTGAAPALSALFNDPPASGSTRAAALRALVSLSAPEAAGILVKQAAADRDEAVRQAAARLQGKLGTDDAVPNLTAVLERGTLSEKQNALATLATIEGSLADEVILQWVHHMAEGHVAADLQADLLAAAGQRSDPRIQKAIDELEAARPKGDALATYREALTGGHAEAGRRIFFERAEASCVRCHKIKGEGGEVGPDLTGIGGRQPREYLLESIVAPNAKIAAGFESVLVVMKDGTTYAGVLKSEDATEIAVNSPEDGLLRLKQADIKSREKGLSSMPDGLGTVLTKPELRDLVEFLSELK